jgi:hypothetical protein
MLLSPARVLVGLGALLGRTARTALDLHALAVTATRNARHFIHAASRRQPLAQDVLGSAIHESTRATGLVARSSQRVGLSANRRAGDASRAACGRVSAARAAAACRAGRRAGARFACRGASVTGAGGRRARASAGRRSRAALALPAAEREPRNPTAQDQAKSQRAHGEIVTQGLWSGASQVSLG